MHVLFLCCFWLEKIQQNEKKNDSELKGMFVRASRNLSRPGFPSSADWPDGSNVAWNRKLILQSSTIRAHEAINLMETWEGGGYERRSDGQPLKTTDSPLQLIQSYDIDSPCGSRSWSLPCAPAWPWPLSVSRTFTHLVSMPRELARWNWTCESHLFRSHRRKKTERWKGSSEVLEFSSEMTSFAFFKIVVSLLSISNCAQHRNVRSHFQ